VTVSYAIDTSSLATVYTEMPQDIHVSLWSAIESLVVSGRLFLPREAYEELLRVDDGLSQWAKRFPGFIVDATLDEIAIVQGMSVRFPGWVEEQRNAADPWLIAHCSHHGRTVVSQEKPKGSGTAPHNMKIPNVAAIYQVPCINFNGLARAEGWTF
jgi:uncharacterized protein DUF4411